MNLSRPKSVTVVALLVLILTVMRLLRFVYAIKDWNFINELLPSLSFYLIVSGLIWVIVGAPAFLGLWFGVTWAPIYTRIIAIVYTINYWLEYIFIVNVQGRQANWLLLGSLNLVLLVWIYWVLSRTSTRVYFGAKYE